MNTVDAIILGIVQGVTEFLPISSTGHLVFVRDWLEIGGVDALAFDSILHLATTVAVVLYFWKDIWTLLQVFLRKIARLPVNKKDLTLLYALGLGTVPAVAGGLLLEGYITPFQTAGVVAVVLFVASLFFLQAEWRYYLHPTRGELTVRRGIAIGFFQMLALLPGFSRSGATIAGGMMVGLSRLEATRFSFLLAIPITLGVGVKKLLELQGSTEAIDWVPIWIGATTALVVAFVVIHFFLAFIRRYTLWPFVWYGFILSGLVGVLAFLA